MDVRLYIEQIPMWMTKKNTMDQIQMYLRALGHPEQALKCIHVAGTNGKGSVCAFLDSTLRQAGYLVGTFTSPHLVDVKERICVGGEPIEEEVFEASFLKVKKVTDQLIKFGYAHPSYFEFLFYMSLVVFHEEKVSFAILETGMGGRMDATNVMKDPIICVITSIGLDHMAYLGDSIEKIAFEKAGIIKPQIPVIYDGNQPDASHVILKKAQEQNSYAYGVCSCDYQILDRDFSSLTFEAMVFQQKMEFHISFGAIYQIGNALLALKTIEELEKLGHIKIDGSMLRKGIEVTRWPGRMEEVAPFVYLDGAHNVDGLVACKPWVDFFREEKQGELLFLFSAVADKEYEKMIRYINDEIRPKEVILCRLRSDRGLDGQALVSAFKQEYKGRITFFEQVKDAFSYGLERQQAEDALLCVGSLYLIGEIKAMLGDKRRKNED